MKRFSSLAALLVLAAGCSASGGDDCCSKGDSCCQAAPAQQLVDKKFLKPSESRTFSVEYVGKIPEVPAGTKKLRVWLPAPQDSTVQTIKNLTFSREAKVATESKYGNKVAYFEIDNPGAAAEIAMKFECTRQEIKTDLDALKSDGKDEADAFTVYRKADKLVLVDDEMKQMSDKIVAGKSGTL